MTATENLTHVLVFRTNINTPSDTSRITAAMNAQSFITDWNVDLDDIDRVLRVVSQHEITEQIIDLVNKAGYQCRELE